MIFLPKQSRGSHRSPADHRSESRLSIPRRAALQRSSSPLPHPSSILKRTVEICREIVSEREVSNTRTVPRVGGHPILLTAVRYPDTSGRRLGAVPIYAAN